MDKREQIALDVINAVDDQLIAQYGLTGVGVGLKVVNGEVTDEPCVKLFVPAKLPKAALPQYARIPRRLKIGGEFRAGLRLLDEGGPEDATTDVEVMPPMSAPPWRAAETEDFQNRLMMAEPRRFRPVASGHSVSHAGG